MTGTLQCQVICAKRYLTPLRNAATLNKRIHRPSNPTRKQACLQTPSRCAVGDAHHCQAGMHVLLPSFPHPFEDLPFPLENTVTKSHKSGTTAWRNPCDHPWWYTENSSKIGEARGWPATVTAKQPSQNATIRMLQECRRQLQEAVRS